MPDYQYSPEGFSHTVGRPIVDDSNTEDNDNTSNCNVLHYRNITITLPISATQFEGIPFNLVFNVIMCMLLLILFTCLRKKAWDYGRLALVQKSEHRWTQVFYGEGSASRLNAEDTGSIDSVEVTLRQDKGIFTWFKSLFHIKDEQILNRCGHDAIQYLSFQRHIIAYLVIVCIICMLIILPVNYQGKLVVTSNSFGRTTLSNLDPASDLLWIHVSFSFFFVPLGVALMRHFSSKLKLKEEENIVSRTLMVSRIPKGHCDQDVLLQHFQEAYSDCVVSDIQLAYDVKKLSELDRQRETATHARLYCDAVLKETGERLKLRPYRCGRICIYPRCPRVDALEYYTEEEHALMSAFDREKSIALLKPLGVAFVTFQNATMAESVYKDHQKTCKCSVNPNTSSLSRQLNPHKWTIEFSPPPEDIYWGNLSEHSYLWYIKAALLYFVLFLLFFFLTTPTIILNYLDVIHFDIKKVARQNAILSQFLPPLLLLVISVTLPVVIRYAVQFVSYWTRSARNHAIMMNAYIFLLFMVVILPLLQLTSVEAFMEWTLKEGGKYRWKCVFMSGNGAFFVNYVITASFIGSALELIRFPELLMYLFYMCYSRSPAEQAGLRKAVLWEFEFGIQYAWLLLIFSVVNIFCLVCPLIAPFGLLYMCMKHCIDRYNIFFVYGPSKINSSVHATAINFVMFSLILLQLCVFMFLFLRNGWTQISVVSVSICIFTLLVFITQISFHWFHMLSPIAYKKLCRRSSSQQNNRLDILQADSDKPFVPVVLKRTSSKNDAFSGNLQDRSYGTNEDSIATTPECDSVAEDENFSPPKTYQRF